MVPGFRTLEDGNGTHRAVVSGSKTIARYLDTKYLAEIPAVLPRGTIRIQRADLVSKVELLAHSS